MSINPNAAVAKPSAVANAMAVDTLMTRALMGGTLAMRAAGQKYLPSWPGEDPEAYRVRCAISTLFPAYSRTIMTLASKPFSKPMTYNKDVPAQIKDWMDTDCDLQGRNLDTFAAGVLETALAHGMCGILVEYPKVEPGSIKTKAQEQAAGLRPYLVHIEPWNVLGGRSERVNGVEVCTMLRLMESTTEPDGLFGEKVVEQVRVLTPGKWELFRKDANNEWQSYLAGFTTMTEIPFVMVYGKRIGFMAATPPMREMAHLNIKHWQSQSDQDNILHVARVPILVVSGVDDDKFQMTIGSNTAVKLPMGAGATFVEHSGSSVGAGRTALEDLKEEMRQAGAELLVLAQGAITATQVKSENSVGMCALQRIVQSTEDSLDQALDFVAKWVGLTDGGTMEIFNDFGAATLVEASAQLLFQMRQAGDLSKVTLLNEIKRRGILASNVNVEEELEAAAADGPELGTMTDPATPPDHEEVDPKGEGA